MLFNKNIDNIFSLTKGILSLATSKEKNRLINLCIVNSIINIFDTVSLIGVMPLVSVILDGESIYNNIYINKLFIFFGEPSESVFILQLAAMATFLIVIGMTSSFVVKIIIKSFGVDCQVRLSKEVMYSCVNTPYKWHLNQNSTELSRFVYSDVLMWSNDGIQRLILSTGHISLLITATVMVIAYATYIGIIGIVLIGFVTYIILSILRKYIRKYSVIRRSSDATTMALASEIMSGIKDVKINGDIEYFINVYNRSFNRYANTMGTMKVLQAFPSFFLVLLGQLSIIFIALSLWFIEDSSTVVATQVAMVLMIISRVVPITVRLASEYSAFQNVTVHLEGIMKILKEYKDENKLTNSIDATYKPIDWGRIHFKNITYTYNSNKESALSNVSFSINRGGVYGITGSSGAGKTTLVDIFLGLLRPNNGGVYFDDNPIDKIENNYWKSIISYVPQHPLIIDDSILSNIIFGDDKKSVDRLWLNECLEIAQLNDYTSEDSLNIEIGDHGKKLSGGQKQRLAIARAFYQKSEIMILDEAMSAIDSKTTSKILDTLYNLRNKMTVIMISHEVLSMKNCDEIFIIENGELIQADTYTNLQKKSSIFQELIEKCMHEKPNGSHV